MKYWRLLLFIISPVAFSACASSRLYKPLPWETDLYKVHSKYPLPNEIQGTDSIRSIQWVGIIDSFWVEGNDQASILFIRASHKYWDYIEDFSIQREKMFVSPLGGGSFIYRKSILNRPVDSTKYDMSRLAQKNNLGIFYGRTVPGPDSVPVLEGVRVRFIHRQYYSTRIWSYEFKKDSTGAYRMENFKELKLAGPGINDPEDKEFE
jgi:hypothetical protein